MKATDILAREFESKSWVHAYLIVGNDHSKRDEIVQFIISQSGCLDADISKVMPEDLAGKKGEIKAEDVRTLLHDVNLTPNGKVRIAIVYNAERLNITSSNVLLKNLEEPAPHVIFILAADNDTVLSTIKSRCQLIRISNLPPTDLKKYSEVLQLGFANASKMIEEIVEGNEIEYFLSGLEAYYRRGLHKNDNLAPTQIKKIANARRQIKQNANARLVLESLILRLE